MILQAKIQQHTTQIDHIFQIIRILIIGSFVSVKTNALLNLIHHEPDINKICLYGTSNIYMKQNINIQMICKMSTKISKITIQEKNVKY